MNYRIMVFASLAACGHCPPKHDDHSEPVTKLELASISDGPQTYPTGCWSAAALASCEKSCTDNNTCCDRTELGCTAHGCGSNGTCEYRLDSADTACTCMPGECSPDRKSVCGCAVANGAITASQMMPCTTDFPTCDPVRRKCVCDPALKLCADAKHRTFCNPDGDIASERCPTSAPACKDGACGCVADMGSPCGCGGRLECDGSCNRASCAAGFTCSSNACVANNRGQSCNCGGSVQADGSCSKPPCASSQICRNNACVAANIDQPCNCGGVFLADGSCNRPLCPEGRACQNGTCCAANFGQPCGACRGTFQCNGTCNNTTPQCLPGWEPDPAAVGQCRTIAEQEVFRRDDSIGGAFNCGLRVDDTIQISCGSGRVQSSYFVQKVRGGNGHCEGVWADNGNLNNCSIRRHYGTALCDNFTCEIVVRARGRRPQCTP